MFAERMAAHKEVTGAEAEKVREVGGLFIIGTERHDARRVDNQLRGRSGRQGDPGQSRFYVAMTDDVMRLFGSDRVLGMMETMGISEDTPIDSKMVSNAIEQAQKTVESRHFQARKNTLEYDDVMNVQRGIIYEERRKVLDGEDLSEYISGMIDGVIRTEVSSGLGAMGYPESEEQLEEILEPFYKTFLTKGQIIVPDRGLKSLTVEDLSGKLQGIAKQVYAKREEEFGTLPDGSVLMRELERVIMLRVVDEYWMEHIDAMDDLRKGIGLRAYGNIKPIDAYKQEGFDMFEAMISGIRHEVVRRLFTVRVRKEQSIERKGVAKASVNSVGGDASVKKQPVKKVKKPGRNDPCPCGKWKEDGSRPLKYKECCGRDQ